MATVYLQILQYRVNVLLLIDLGRPVVTINLIKAYFLMNAACPVVTGSIIPTSDGLFQVSQLFWSYTYVDVPCGQAPTGLFSANLKRWIAFGTTLKKKKRDHRFAVKVRCWLESINAQQVNSSHWFELFLKSYWMW